MAVDAGMETPTNATLVAKSQSWTTTNDDQWWRYDVGFDHRGEACRLEISGGTEHGLALAWRTVDGQWLGRFRFDDSYVTAHLSLLDIELVENIAKMLRD